MTRLWTHLLGAAGLLTLATACGSTRASTMDDGLGAGGSGSATGPVEGWLSWRGPHQNGTSDEVGLVEKIELGGENHLWTYAVSSGGTPVVANGRVFGLGYSGTGVGLREQLFCLDEATGKELWTRHFTDFLNDAAYNRYAIGSPTIDPDTGNVFSQTSAGLLHCHTRDGDLVWEVSLMEELGRITFPNGRIGAPVVDGDRVLIHAIISSWGSQGPARDRFFALDKHTGKFLWGCTPGVEPKDSSFSLPVLEWRDGRRLMYCGTGCGNVVCIDVRTGECLWRFQLTKGGANSSCVIAGDRVIEIHGKENLDSSEVGRMVAIQLGAVPGAGTPGPVVLGFDHELWRNHLYIFTSSPVLVGDRVYQTVHTGELCSVDVATGTVLWEKKFGAEQIHASPVYGDGKLYVPMNDGGFHIVRPTDEGPVTLCSVQLEGACLAAPAIDHGRIFVHTTEKLYCFGEPGPGATAPAEAVALSATGAATQLQVVPADLHLRRGETVEFRAQALDAKGNVVTDGVSGLAWTVPPTLDAQFTEDGLRMTIPEDARFAADVLKVAGGGVNGSVRLRVVSSIPFVEDFEAIPLTVDHYAEEGVKMAFPPSGWYSSKPKWEVRDLDGNKVLAKRLDNLLFQRSMNLVSDTDHHDYTVQVDIYTDGTRRMKSTGGVVNQRYLISLEGNAQDIEISSNYERIQETVPFAWKAKEWYTLKTSCENHDDGSVTVRAKAWLRAEPEPEAWNIEFRHENGHQHGAYGIFGYAPQCRFPVYLDNLKVTPNP